MFFTPGQEITFLDHIVGTVCVFLFPFLIYFCIFSFMVCNLIHSLLQRKVMIHTRYLAGEMPISGQASAGMLKLPYIVSWLGECRLCVQVASMVSIFLSQKRSMQADIHQHRELLSTLHVRSPSAFQVPCVATARTETCHFVMLAVQLLDFLSILRLHRTQPRTTAAAASSLFRARSSWSAVLPVRSGLDMAVSKTHARVQAAPNFKHFQRLLATVQVQGVLPDACSVPSSLPSVPAACLDVSAQSRVAGEAKNEVQHKLGRWPWSVMGRQVGIHGRLPHSYYPGCAVVWLKACCPVSGSGGWTHACGQRLRTFCNCCLNTSRAWIL
jgi:hypothetical protein